MFDKNNDGYIDLKELKTVSKPNPKVKTQALQFCQLAQLAGLPDPTVPGDPADGGHPL